MNYLKLDQQLKLGILTLVLVVITASGWYHWQEGMSWIDALYMTVITLTTVGYQEVTPLDHSGRLFTILLLLSGIIVIGYMVNRFTEALIQGHFQQRILIKQQKRLVENLNNHYIICGFGRTGIEIAKQLIHEKVPLVVIDNNIEVVEMALKLGYIAIEGDATLDSTLEKVAINKAVCLLTALSSDADNLYVILSAKTLNSNIRVVVRANTKEAIPKLSRVGADIVVCPYTTAGKRMAHSAKSPILVDVVDQIFTGINPALAIEGFILNDPHSNLLGKTLKDAKLRNLTGALVIAIQRADQSLIPGPSGDTNLLLGDILICMGTPQQISLVHHILDPIYRNPVYNSEPKLT